MKGIPVHATTDPFDPRLTVSGIRWYIHIPSPARVQVGSLFHEEVRDVWEHVETRIHTSSETLRRKRALKIMSYFKNATCGSEE